MLQTFHSFPPLRSMHLALAHAPCPGGCRRRSSTTSAWRLCAGGTWAVMRALRRRQGRARCSAPRARWRQPRP